MCEESISRARNDRAGALSPFNAPLEAISLTRSSLAFSFYYLTPEQNRAPSSISLSLPPSSSLIPSFLSLPTSKVPRHTRKKVTSPSIQSFSSSPLFSLSFHFLLQLSFSFRSPSLHYLSSLLLPLLSSLLLSPLSSLLSPLLSHLLSPLFSPPLSPTLFYPPLSYLLSPVSCLLFSLLLIPCSLLPSLLSLVARRNPLTFCCFAFEKKSN